MDTPAFMNPFAVTCLSVLLLYLILQITVCLMMAKGLKKKENTVSLLKPAVFRPGGASASSSPLHCLQPPPALAGQRQGITGRCFGENSAWIAVVGCNMLNFFPYPFLLHNFKAMCGKFFQKLVGLGFFPVPRFRYPPSPIISKSK